MEESSFPAIASVAEMPKVTDGTSRRLAVTVDEGKETLFIISTEGRACHVLSYSFGSSSSSVPALKKTSLLFDQEVEAAECYRQDSGVCAVVLTRDGRLWHGSLHSLKKGAFPHNSIFTEYSLENKLLGVKILAVCSGCKDGPAVVAVRSSLAPPQVMWLGRRHGDVATDVRTVPGLEHIHSAITSVLFLHRDKVTTAFWRLLTRVPSCDQDLESIVLFGFADDAIRSCLITDSKVIHPVHLLARSDSQEQEVLSILAMTDSGSSLIDTISFLGSNGAVSTLDESSSFRRTPSGLSLKGPWTSASVIECNGRRSVLTTRHDGTSHLLVFAKESVGADSVCIQLPVREGMTTVNSCVSPQGTWLAFGNVDGSVLLLQMGSNVCEKLLLWEQDDAISSGILGAIAEQPQANPTSSLARSQRLRRFDQMSKVASTNVNGSALQLSEDLQHAMDTTDTVLRIACGSRNRSSNVAITEEGDTIAVQGTLVEGLVPPSSGGTFISSFHACFGRGGAAVDGTVPTICRRPYQDDENGIPVRCEGVAVTDSRAVGDNSEQRIEMKLKGATVDAFLSVTDTHDPSNKEDSQVHFKRRKTSSSALSSDSLVIPL